MIDYFKTAYGLNLLFRVHGSSMYKAFLPALFSVVIFNVLDVTLDISGQTDNINHPYAIGVLVTSISFLIVFRANQGYARYWEACSHVHHFMSKWLDATTHAGIYHLQQKHYDPIKPPSFFDHYDLDFMGLTRDRERGRCPSLAITGTYSSAMSEDSAGVEETMDPYAPLANSKGGSPSGASRRGFMERSINKVDVGTKNDGKKTRWKKSVVAMERLDSNNMDQPPQAPPPNTSGDNGLPSLREHNDENDEQDRFDRDASGITIPTLAGHEETAARTCHPHLMDAPRYDGGWGLAQEGRPVPPGGFTPSLFLQELAHLSSLLVAVAFSTLRNDIEGAESPLDMYVPGEPWPEVDPNTLPKSVRKEIWPKHKMWKNWEYWVGSDRTDEMRTLYNANRPMLVLGGVSDAEIAALQRARGPAAKTQLVWNWLSEFIIREHLAGTLGKVGPPIVSRCFQFLSDGMIYYNHARKIMFIPFPFPSAQISVFFTMTILWAVPLMLTQYVNNKVLGSFITFFTTACLVGLHEVGRELENPFRNIPNEVPLGNLLAQYNEGLMTMYQGYHPDLFWKNSGMRYEEVYRQRMKDMSGPDGKDAGLGDEDDKRQKKGPSRTKSSSVGKAEAELPSSTTNASVSPTAPITPTSTTNDVQDGKVKTLEETVARQQEELSQLRDLISKTLASQPPPPPMNNDPSISPLSSGISPPTPTAMRSPPPKVHRMVAGDGSGKENILNRSTPSGVRRKILSSSIGSTTGEDEQNEETKSIPSIS